MRVVVLIPSRPDGGVRDQIWAFCKAWWLNNHPDWEIFEHPGPPGLFNRSAAINAASETAGSWDVAIILDKDVIVNPEAVEQAVIRCHEEQKLVLPHNVRIDLNKTASTRVMRGDRSNWTKQGWVANRWTDSVSCCVMVPASVWTLLGGFDPLFVGWGYEDSAFIAATSHWLGDPIVLESELFHLWHPHASEGNRNSPTRLANWDRLQAYEAADHEQMLDLVAEAKSGQLSAHVRRDKLIPMIFHRTVPESYDPLWDAWWEQRRALHPDWEFRTYQDPIDTDKFPMTAALWDKCETGAQKADLIRLEALYHHGGVYVDADCRPVGVHDPLRFAYAYAAWEDETTIPNAVMGAVPRHPAIFEALTTSISLVERGAETYTSGVAVTTKVFKDRSDMLILPPGVFYPHHYLQKKAAGQNIGPWVIEEHMWHHSWGTPESKDSIEKRQR